MPAAGSGDIPGARPAPRAVESAPEPLSPELRFESFVNVAGRDRSELQLWLASALIDWLRDGVDLAEALGLAGQRRALRCRYRDRHIARAVELLQQREPGRSDWSACEYLAVRLPRIAASRRFRDWDVDPERIEDAVLLACYRILHLGQGDVPASPKGMHEALDRGRELLTSDPPSDVS